MTRKEKRERMDKVKTTINTTIIDSIENLVVGKGKGKVKGKEIALVVEGSVNVLLVKGFKIAPFMPNEQYRELILNKAIYILEQFNQQFEELYPEKKFKQKIKQNLDDIYYQALKQRL